MDNLKQPNVIAYFSMEVGIKASMPTYSGGLGILAGDYLKAAADLGAPLIGITLLNRKGYFRQHLDADGNQTEEPAVWKPEDFLQPMPNQVTITLEGRDVHIKVWQYTIKGVNGGEVPVYFLDTNLPENSPYDQSLTDTLYGGDLKYRICQEAVLGIGGLDFLRILDHGTSYTFHMNEGHAAFLALSLLSGRLAERDSLVVKEEDINLVREQCVFTTHTPVPAGHDQFPTNLVQQVLGDRLTHIVRETACCFGDMVNMTFLALFFSRHINGVAMSHGELSHGMFPQYPIGSITNGIHALTWVALSFQKLYDKHMSEWRDDSLYLRYAVGISLDEIRNAHIEAKAALLAEVERRTKIKLNPNVLTIGFARRATAYKRFDLVFSDVNRLKKIAHEVGPFQMIFGGKAHPKDEGGKQLIRNVFKAAKELSGAVPVIYLEEYNMDIAMLMCSGVDLWLNTPQKPQEASGTSGMKAAANGVPSLSVIDGWWVEGWVEGVTGWSIDEDMPSDGGVPPEALSIYHKLEHVILPMFYGKPEAYEEIMRHSIALNGSFFNAIRMLNQYLDNAYPERTRISIMP